MLIFKPADYLRNAALCGGLIADASASKTECFAKRKAVMYMDRKAVMRKNNACAGVRKNNGCAGIRYRARGFPYFDKIRSAYIISVVMSKWYYSSLKRTLGGSMHHSDGTPVMSG